MGDHLIYVIGDDEGHQKIGLSRSLPARLKTLSLKHGKGIKAHYTARVASSDVFEIERLAHHHLRDKRAEGEWFDVTKDEAIEAVDFAISTFTAGGRAPSTGTHTEHASVLIPATTALALEEWRRKQPKIPSKSEAIRMLVDKALAEGADRNAR